jgi:hypothetical protein
MKLRTWSILGVGLLAGCLGTIGDGGNGSGGTAGGGAGSETLGDPGTLVMHRLNRVEYANTVRDLLGTTLTPADTFPADDVSFGFDNIAQVQTLAPLQFELYEQAAALLAEEALAIPSALESWQFEAEEQMGTSGAANGSVWVLSSNGEVGAPVDIPTDGQYRVRARVYGQQAGPDLPQAGLMVGGTTLQTFDVAAEQANPEIIEVTADVTAGNKQVGVAFLNDYYEPPDDRNLYVDWIEFEGPLGVVGENPIREKLVTCDPVGAECRRDIISDLARRAFRRPVTDEEVNRLLTLVDLAVSEGDTVDRGLELAVQAILLSPHFLFRPELDDDPTSDEPHPLNDFELASRMSYFLWSSMPDEELFAAAEAGDLTGDDEKLAAQIDRMLADPKADALVKNFAGQWLLIRALTDHVPDYEAFPDYDQELEDAFRTETELFFGEFLAGKESLNKLLSADFTFINDRLAAHYGLPSPGSDFERVSLEGNDERFGLLTMGSLLTVTSYPTRTSPVKRGVWILEQLLCDGPPPPPPGVEALEEVMTSGSLRERLAQHREDPTCATCHDLMDPLGLAMENYDGIGAYRTEDEGEPIDASGELPNEAGAFGDLPEMVALLEQDERFSTCLVEKLLVYGLGRGVESTDHVYIEDIVMQSSETDYRLPEVLKAIVMSDLFRMRRGTKEEG